MPAAEKNGGQVMERSRDQYSMRRRRVENNKEISKRSMKYKLTDMC